MAIERKQKINFILGVMTGFLIYLSLGFTPIAPQIWELTTNYDQGVFFTFLIGGGFLGRFIFK